MYHKRLLSLLLLLQLSIVCAWAVGTSGMYQWSVQLRGYISPETGKEPQAFLWVPQGCQTVQAVVFAQQNMTEEMIFKYPHFQQQMQQMGVALLWVAPAFTNTWDPADGCQKVFDEMITAIAFQSGHPEIAQAPIIPLGHSAQATFPWNFAAWNPGRTLCVISFHGDAPRTNLCGYGTANVEWGRTRNIDGIPALMVMGEYEWWEARLLPALAFQMMYPESCISFLCDIESGHFECMPETASYIALFIRKALEQRGPSLKPLRRADGWLAKSWSPDDDARPEAAPAASYKGDRHEAFWYFDREMAQLTELQIGLQVADPLLLRDLMDAFPFVLFVPGADVSDLDIRKVKSQQHRGRSYQYCQFQAIDGLFPFLRTHSLIPGRQNHRDDGNTQAFVVDVKHDVHAFCPHLFHHAQQFFLRAEGLPAHKNGM